MTPDLNLLLIFEAMMLHQNVTLAAAHMKLTQSAMSNALGRLRRQYDDPLFINSGGAMLPTPRALELAASFQQALAIIRRAGEKRKSFDPLRSTRTFRFFMSDVGAVIFLPTLMKHLVKIGATVKVETAQLESEELRGALASGEIDLVAGYLPSLKKAVEQVPLFREHYVCMTRRSHPLGRKSDLTLDEFLSASHLLISSMGSGHKIIERTLERQGVKRNVALRVPHFMAVPMIVAETDLVVTVPRRVANAFSKLAAVRLHPLPLAIPNFDVTLSWHPRFADDPGIQWMRALMIELFQEPARRKGKEEE